MTAYSYTVNGSAAGDQTWETSGTVELPEADFHAAVETVLRESFMKLTDGKAIFGKPGVGCNGPYSITRFTIGRAPS
jgi:hypothetical protein